MRVHIRWMIRRDMTEVMSVENLSFDQPWPEKVFLDSLRGFNCIGMVAEYGEKIVGFMVYTLSKKKIRIENFAVHPDFRRADIGSQMLTKLVGKLASHKRDRVVVRVRESWLIAQLFFRSHGFRAVRVLRAWYEDTEEDAFILRYMLPVRSS